MICMIPARGGSTRLPGKNIKKLDGQHIINRVIKIVKASGLFSNIVVSTDSEEIRDVVGDRCMVIMRPARISGDVPEDNVLIDVMAQFQTNDFCRIYPFAALLTPERLRNGFLEYKTGGYDAVLECQKYGHPVSRAINIEDGYVTPQYVSKPTNYLSNFYHDAGTFMFTNSDALNKDLAERNIKWLPVKEWEAQDIDNADDWEMLEMKWRYHNGML